jgi:hypothetical protein
MRLALVQVARSSRSWPTDRRLLTALIASATMGTTPRIATWAGSSCTVSAARTLSAKGGQAGSLKRASLQRRTAAAVAERETPYPPDRDQGRRRRRSRRRRRPPRAIASSRGQEAEIPGSAVESTSPWPTQSRPLPSYSGAADGPGRTSPTLHAPTHPL